MRNIIDAVIMAVAFFAFMAFVRANDDYAALVAAQSTGYCNVNFGSTTATLKCSRIARLSND